MLNQTVLKQAAQAANLADSYLDAWGNKAFVSSETLERLLTALGFDTSSDQALLASVNSKSQRPVLAPVIVLREDEANEYQLYLDAQQKLNDFSWQITTEQGEVIKGKVTEQVVRDQRASEQGVTLTLPNGLAWGYHQLTVTKKAQKSPFNATLIVTPRECFKQSALQQGKKMWGPSVQLYTLKSHHNWGMGDFGDLKQLVAEIASRGGDFVGLNPIHALFPANPEAASPYSPSSRRWLNVLYIDVASVPEFALSVDAQQVVGSNEFQARLQQARDSHWVNYTEVAKLKLSVLPLLFAEFKQRHLDANSLRGEQFLEFVEQGGDSLLQQAAFDALHAHLSQQQEGIWGWPVFPEQYQKFDAPAVQAFIEQQRDQVHLYMYMQWLADCQINEAQQLAQSKGMAIGLYRDLAVGVADSGSETWADTGDLVTNVSVGAPPDILGPLGQNWGLPPLNPETLQTTAYAPFIALLRANMLHCGALRIDHVLGLLRLWWIPKGEDATQGAYLYYPVKEMLAILALESHRHQCSVIGEDLGTVPDEIVDILRDAGVHSYKVFFFETSKQDGGYISPKHYATQAMATLCTHDMPTLRGFWHCDDLKLGRELGLYPDEQQLQGLFDNRLRCKQGILDSLNWHGFLPSSVGRDASTVAMDASLAQGLQLHVAAGASALLSVQLEDWLEMDQPVNIPGTVNEYPNWRRKLSMDLEHLFELASVNHIAQRLTQVRAEAENICP